MSDGFRTPGTDHKKRPRRVSWRLDYDDAIADYERAIALDPKLATAFVDRGDAYFELGDYERAANDYRSAVQLDDQLGSAYRSVAWHGDRMIPLEDSILDDQAAAVLALPNRTPNGLVLPRRETVSSLNMLHRALADYRAAAD